MALTNWERLSRMPGTAAYWVFRGSFQIPLPGGGANVRAVAWADREIVSSSRVDGRMATPGRIVRGLPETVGGPPERVSTEIVLDDLDEELVPYFVGGPTPEEEYTTHSVLNLRGKLYYCLQGADGTVEEIAVTPTLVTAGPPARKGRQITIPLASWDERFFPQVKDQFTVAALAEAEVVEDGSTYYQAGQEPFTSTLWGEVVSEWSQGLDQMVPWAYGRPTLLPIRASGDTADRQTWVAFTSRDRPDLSRWGQWSRFLGSVGDIPASSWFFSAHDIRVSVRNSRGDLVVVWVVVVSWDWTLQSRPATTTRIIDRLAEGDRLILVPEKTAHLGVRSLGAAPPPVGTGGLFARANPVSIARKMILDHAPLATFAGPSWTKAAAYMDAASGMVGGVLRDGETILDAVEDISRPFGLVLWVNEADELEIVVGNNWTHEESEAAILDAGGGTIPTISEELILTDWEEVVPIDGEARGAAASEVAINWDAETVDVWPPETLIRFAPGATKLPIAQEARASVSGRWLYPPAATDALADITSRRQFASRRFKFATHVWVGLKYWNALVRVSHRDGAAPGGYVRRLARIERVEIDPGGDFADVVMEDLGPLEFIQVGILDSQAHWLAYAPPVGAAAVFVGGSKTVTLSSDPGPVVGCSLWTFPATHPAMQRSWRIEGQAGRVLTISQAAPLSVTIFGTVHPRFHRRAWVIMHTHASKGSGFRRKYIRLCKPNGRFTNAERGYRYSGG